MITIPLSKGKVSTIDDIDADLADHKWYAQKKGVGIASYAVRTIYPYRKGEPRREVLHRVIMERVLGRPLSRKEQVDHIDGDGLNNARSNLRLATGSQNCHNIGLRRNNKTGYKGVSLYVNGRYHASIMVNGKVTSLGYHSSAEEASEAYQRAARELVGEFARLK
jgi:hypothetical protein